MRAMRVVAVAGVLLLASLGQARAEDPLQHDAMGPLLDVTGDWAQYQPASEFCVDVNGFDMYTALSGDEGPACDNGDLSVNIDAPALCDGCRRLFIDYGQIPANDPEAGMFFAHGHVFFRIHAWNDYKVDPVAHSPNIKNLTNDKAVVPDGSPQEPVVTQFDTYAIAYVGSTGRTTHSDIQGPYYVGPRYLNAAGDPITGAYVDLLPGSPMADPAFNEIRYWVGFNSGEPTCPDNLSEEYQDGNYGYYGCAAHPAISESFVDPFAT